MKRLDIFSEADMAYENPDLLEVMSLGRRFGPLSYRFLMGPPLLGIEVATFTMMREHPLQQPN
jgi:hypothetical protein